MNKQKMLTAILVLVGSLTITIGCAQAQPGEHPAYLRALSDLRYARWLVQHRDGRGVANADEQVAINEMTDAIALIRHAAVDDGKDVNYQPPPDAREDGRAKLNDALTLLQKAHNDLAQEEDNNFAHGLRNRALQRVDAATRATEIAVQKLRAAQ